MSEEEPEIVLEPDDGDDSAYPDTLSCPEGQVHFGIEAQTFLAHWLGKLGLEVEGAALIVGEGCAISILHPETGKIMTCEAIAKQAGQSKVRSIQ